MKIMWLCVMLSMSFACMNGAALSGGQNLDDIAQEVILRLQNGTRKMGLVVFSDSLLKKMMEKIDKVLFDEETGVYDLWVIRALITGHDRMDQVQVAVSNEGGRQNEIYDKDFILSLANYLLEKSQERLAKKAALEEIVRLLNVSPARM